MNVIQLLENCEKQSIATMSALKDRDYNFDIPETPVNWKIDHKTEISVWWTGYPRISFSAPTMLIGYSICLESDDKLWLHLSISKKETGKKRSIPTYQEAKEICQIIYKDKWYVQYFPPQEEYVNIAEVLHFWHCIESNPMPDFRKLGVMI